MDIVDGEREEAESARDTAVQAMPETELVDAAEKAAAARVAAALAAGGERERDDMEVAKADVVQVMEQLELRTAQIEELAGLLARAQQKALEAQQAGALRSFRIVMQRWEGME